MTDQIEKDARKGDAKPRSFLRRLVRFVLRLTIWVVGFFVFVFGGAWLWFESSSADEVLARKAEAFLAEGLQRDVTIGDLSLRPGLPAKLVVTNARLGNVPGTLGADQATLERVELKLSLRALLRGRVRISDVVIVHPTFVLEVMRDGERITTNLPKWSRPRDPEKERPDLGVDTITVRGGTFELIDHAHDLGVVARGIDIEIDPNLRDLKNPRATGDVEAGDVRFRAGRIEFPPVRVLSRARLEERVLWVESLDARSSATTLTAKGPIRANRLDLETTLRADLEKLRASLGLEQELRGSVEARAEVSGFYKDVRIEGTFEAPDLLFDVYDVKSIRGSFVTIENGLEVVADEGTFAGGTLSAKYAAFSREGKRSNILEVRHVGVSLESVLGVWDIRDTGLLAVGNGELQLAWDNGDPDIELSGKAVLTPDAGRKTRAEFGTPIGGAVQYQLSDGELNLEASELRSAKSLIDLRGTIGLRASSLDLRADIESRSFEEVDRFWSDLARAFGQDEWELLQISGRGKIRASVAGEMKAPKVDIRVSADGFAYGGIELERADGRLVFDGKRQELLFDNVRFEEGQGEMVVQDRIGLGGEGMDLAIRVGLQDWGVESLLRFLDLDFPVRGLATGQVTVTGAPDAGSATFSPLEITDGTSTINLAGLVAWTSEEKGLSFNLDVGLRDVPFETIAGVLDLGSDLPLTGDTTGTVHLDGPLTNVSGAGSITVNRGAILGEPVDLISSELVMNAGVLRLRNLDIRMPAGFIRGEAKLDLAADRFGYVITASEIDIASLRGYPSVRNVLTGKLIVLSTGAGTMDDPELVLDVRVEDAVLLEVPVQDPGVSLYLTLREGEFKARGNVGAALTLEGSGRLDVASGAIDGTVSLSVSNIENIMRRFEKRTGMTIRGRADLSLALAGSISPVEDLVVDGRIDTIDVSLGEHSVRAAKPPQFSMKNGVLALTSFELLVDDQTFAAGGHVSFADGTIDVSADGLIEAGLLAVAIPDLRASGDIGIALNVRGTFDDPRVDGTAEIRDADVRILGFPHTFRDVRSTLVMSGNLIEIDSFSARLGGGVVSAGGRVELEGGVPVRVRINTQGRDVDLRLSQGLSIGGGFDLVLAGNPEDRMLLKGEAKLTKVLYTKDLEIGAAIVDFIVSRRARVAAIGQEWESRLALDVEIDARDAIRVRNNLARITGSAGVRLSGTLAQPVMLGDATIDEGGQIRISNVEYRVVSGAVNFQNPFRIDPYIDLTAEGRYRNEYDLTIVVTGTPDELQMAVSSDPPIADLSILNVFGVETTSAGAVNTRSAVSSAGESIIDSSVGSLVGSRLSFADNLRLEGLTGPDPRVTIEKSIADDVRAIVTYTMNGAGDNIEVIEWRATPLFLIQATRDSTKDATYFLNAIDVSFSRRFGGQW
jgi:hypothetical protein